MHSPCKGVWQNCQLILIACTKIFNTVNYYHCKVFTLKGKVFNKTFKYSNLYLVQNITTLLSQCVN